MNYDNLILNTDSYKVSHFEQYPPGTTDVFSYIEARGNDTGIDYTIFFGLQMFLMELAKKRVTMKDVYEAAYLLTVHGEPFNHDGWMHLVRDHGGKLPLEIRALPEGTKVPLSTPMVTVRNTCPKCYWLTSYIETALLRAVWYPTTVCTISHHIKSILREYHKETSTAPIDILDWKLHDFGARGVSSEQSAGIGGCAHLVNFKGTDTVSALLAAHKFYGALCAGGSIPAAEHTTIILWSAFGGEEAAFRNMLDKFAQEGKMVAVVSDSYDIHHAVKDIWGKALKDRVISSGATVVVRPDSGDPATVVVDVLRELARAYGTTKNEKGYMVLPPCIRVIQGDGINARSIESILFSMKLAGFAVDNVAFGMGGALLQQPNRDTFKFAMKASAARIDGIWHSVFKAPKTDPMKRSKGGLLAVMETSQGLQVTTMGEPDGWTDRPNALVPVFRDGELLVKYSLSDIRERVEK